MQRLLAEEKEEEQKEEKTEEKPTVGRCCVALCDVEAAGRCPSSGQPLCWGHLKRQRRRVQQLGDAALRVVAAAPVRLAELERQRRRLEADRDELAEQLAGLAARLGYWRQRVAGAAAEELDRLGARIRALADVLSFAESADREAEEEHWKQLFQMMDRIGDSVDFLCDCESPARAAESARVAGCLAEAEAARASLERELGGLLAGPPAVLGPLAGRAWRIAVCDNTAGYWLDADRSVVRSRLAPSTGGATRLAPVCAVVALHADDSPDHLALLGAHPASAASAVGRIRPPLRWSSQVYSLRCDPAQQLLFLSQGRAGIWVVDLAGRLRRRLTPAGLGLSDRAKLTGLCLAPGRLFVLSYKEHLILAVSRTDWSVLASHNVADCYKADFFTESLAWCPGGQLLLTDWAGQAVGRFDAESGHRIGRLPASEELSDESGGGGAFSSPYDVLADRRGRLYVVDVRNNLVRLLDSDGRRCLRTFGLGSDEGNGDGQQLSGPVSLDLWEGDASWDWLLVADSNNRRVRIFRVAKANDAVFPRFP